MSRAKRKSSRNEYQARWNVYRDWCLKEDVSSCRSSIPKTSRFLTELFKVKKLSPTTFKGYRSGLSAVFSLNQPEFRLKSLEGHSQRHEIKASEKEGFITFMEPCFSAIRSETSTIRTISPQDLKSLTKSTLFLVALVRRRG